MPHSPVPPVAHTKLLLPAAPDDFLARPQLLSTLEQTVSNHKLTLLSAPAGSGKTTLAASLSHLPLAWLSLDEIDDEPLHFLLALSAALGRLAPACRQAVRGFLEGQPDPVAQIQRVVAVLVNEIVETLPEPFVLVLDDLYVLTEPAVYEALDYLLERLPPQMHLIVTTRYDPPLRLSLLRARGHLAEVRLPDMRFTLHETEQFLNEKQQLDLTPEELDLLQARIAGWPAGLRLLAGSLRAVASARRGAFLRGLAHTDHFLFDFLAEEVLAHQEATIRTFLMQISILPELTAAACEAVTGRSDARTLLASLHQRNLFLEMAAAGEGDHGPVYRFHDLFARFLCQRLADEMPEQIATLHQRAAEASRRPENSIRHLLVGGLWEEAAATLERQGEALLARGLPRALRRWITALPAAYQERPRLAYLQGICAIYHHDLDVARAQLETALAASRAADDRVAAGLALASLVNIAFYEVDFARAITLTGQALAYPVPPAVRVKLLVERARIVLFQGEADAAHTDLEAAWSTVRASGDDEALLPLLAGYIPGFAGLPGGLDRLDRLCREADARVRKRHDYFHLALERARSMLYLYRGEFDAAVAALQQTRALAEVFGSLPPWEHGVIVMNEILIRVARGEAVALAEVVEWVLGVDNVQPAAMRGLYYVLWHACWLQQRPALGRPLYDRLQPIKEERGPTRDNIGFPIYLVSTEGQLALAEGRLPAAIMALEEAARLEKEAAHFNLFGSARTQLAYAYLRSGREADALDTLSTALTECRQQGAPGRILMEGRIAVAVLELAVAHDAHAAEASDMLQRLGAGARTPLALPGSAEHLTPRELEVLGLLLTGAANQEIAKEMVISIHTAKRHVSNILGKLGAANRTEAAARARELGLRP